MCRSYDERNMSRIKNCEYSMFSVTEDLHGHDSLSCRRTLEATKICVTILGLCEEGRLSLMSRIRDQIAF